MRAYRNLGNVSDIGERGGQNSPTILRRVRPPHRDVYTCVRARRAWYRQLALPRTSNTTWIVAAPTSFQHLQMSPLQRHPKQCPVSNLWRFQSCVIRHLFQHPIEIVGGPLGSESEDVEEGKKAEGGGGLDGQLGSRIQPTTQELDVLRLGTFAPAVIDIDVVDAV